MNKKKVLIIGSSGHSKVVIDIFEKEGTYDIIGLLDTYRNIGEETLGYKILGSEDDLPQIIARHPNCKVFVAIGDNWIRKKMVTKVISIMPNVNFATAIHPSAQIGRHTSIGEGVVIMAGAIVNSGANIGDFTIINTKASIDHDSKMLSFSSLAPNVTTGGNVLIGEFSAMAIGATIQHGISIGKHSVIGAGSILMRNCGDNLVMYGVPAKKIRKREVGEKYL